MRKDKINSEDLIVRSLTDEISSEEKKIMENFLKDKDKKEEFDKYIELWDESHKLKNMSDINVEEDWQLVRSRMGFDKKTKKIPAAKYFARIAAILILAMGLLYLYNLVINISENQISQFTEYSAEQNSKDINLVDGSKITLNNNSRIILNSTFNLDNRDVILEGEAFFSIAHNSHVPFRVHAANSVVEVLGTSFNVKIDTSKVVVDVVSGHVSFYNPGTKIDTLLLEKEEEGVYLISKSKLRKENWDPNHLAWRTKELVFIDSDMEYVFTTLADHFNKELIYNATDISERYSNTFKGASLDDIITVVKQTMDTKLYVRVNEDQIIVHTNATN